MKKIFVLIIAALCFYTSSAQVESEFDNYVKNQRSAIDSLKGRYEHDIDLLEKEYEEYIKAERDAYNKFIKEKKAIWGNDNVVETTNTEWVEYSKDGKSRSVVDFEEGEATIEIIITPEEEKSEDVVEKKIEDKLKELIINKGKTKDYDTQQEKARDLQDTPILEEQIETPSGEIVTKDNLDEGVKEIAKEAEIQKTVIEGDDGQKRQVITVKLDLVPDHIKKRAEKYQSEVEKYCRIYNVDPSMAFAVMQTESSFNPKAKSHVPAYGLMQIVPSSAGQDCAKSLKKPFKKPTANYLYEPANNIEMGVHYLHLLKKRYYTNVKDSRSQDLCVIASYNTGAGNVARALRGDTNISKAIPQINTMTYDELFRYFEKKLLPETQNYIRKVTERMNNFNKWMK